MPSSSVVTLSSPDDYYQAVSSALDSCGALSALSSRDSIVLKPNVVNQSPPPVTTDWRFTAAVAEYLSSRTAARLVIAEGSGEGSTLSNMKHLGYERIGLPLIDLDAEPLVRLSHPLAATFRDILLPRLVVEGAVISLPTAKEHTITGVTLGLKNLVGCLPARHYGGYWSYKKSRIHQLGEDGAIADLVLYLEPTCTVIDASVGLLGGHLSGSAANPPLGKIVAGCDVIEADREAAKLLGHPGESIGHLAAAEELRRRARSAGMLYNVAEPGRRRDEPRRAV